MQEDDYMMRIIKSSLQKILRNLKGKNPNDIIVNENSDDGVLSSTYLTTLMILRYVDEGKINKAENILFDVIESDKSSDYYEIAMAFYDDVGKLDDNTLAKLNFSRAEIEDGIDAVKKIYGKL